MRAVDRRRSTRSPCPCSATRSARSTPAGVRAGGVRGLVADARITGRRSSPRPCAVKPAWPLPSRITPSDLAGSPPVARSRSTRRSCTPAAWSVSVPAARGAPSTLHLTAVGAMAEHAAPAIGAERRGRRHRRRHASRRSVLVVADLLGARAAARGEQTRQPTRRQRRSSNFMDRVTRQILDQAELRDGVALFAELGDRRVDAAREKSSMSRPGTIDHTPFLVVHGKPEIRPSGTP